MIIGIQDEILRLHSLGLLELLLKDKTTKANILWATDAYQNMGPDYERDKEIKTGLITGEHSGVIRNRARKALEQQTERTRQHAEVFTPLWICKQMNEATDEGWFPKKNPRPFDSSDKIKFLSRKKWWYYVDARRLEITCGEAPYLVSRYDVSTGESIPIEERIGLLDHKLRVVNESRKFLKAIRRTLSRPIPQQRPRRTNWRHWWSSVSDERNLEKLLEQCMKDGVFIQVCTVFPSP